MRIGKAIFVLCLAAIGLPGHAFAQCGSTVPSYTVDMTGNPDSVWTSPSVSRTGYCCSASGSDRCIVFNLTLDTLAAAIKLDISGGTGSTFYQVNCGTSIATGSSVCISGGGTIEVTVCKPGGNAHQYTITSIPKGHITASSIFISRACTTELMVHELVESTITWTALDSSYNYSLDCASACDTTTITADTSFPAYLDYKVCGTPINVCAGSSFCDTLRVFFLQDLLVTLDPPAANICTGMPSVNIKANATGGKRPYSYSWTNTADTDSSIDVGAGTYIVTVTDAALCQVAKDTVVVTARPLPTPSISGLSSICEDATYTFSVTAVSGHSYLWTSANGTIIGSNTSSSVSIRWENTGTGNVSITQTNNSTGCVGTDAESVTIAARPGTAPIQH